LGPQNGGRCWQVVAIRRWSLAQVWLYCHNVKIFLHGLLGYNSTLVQIYLKLCLNDSRYIMISPNQLNIKIIAWNEKTGPPSLCHSLNDTWEGGSKIGKKKCHVLFEWPLTPFCKARTFDKIRIWFSYVRRLQIVYYEG